MKKINYVAAGLVGAILSAVSITCYMEYITTPSKLYLVYQTSFKNRTLPFAVQDRRGSITLLFLEKNFLELKNAPKDVNDPNILEDRFKDTQKEKNSKKLVYESKKNYSLKYLI